VLHQAIYWNVPAMAFIVLVAVGADYNLLLITRIREESASGVRSGVIRAVRSTGGVITSAGIIFAASMFGLLFGSLSSMVQTGVIIGVGLWSTRSWCAPLRCRPLRQCWGGRTGGLPRRSPSRVAHVVLRKAGDRQPLSAVDAFFACRSLRIPARVVPWCRNAGPR